MPSSTGCWSSDLCTRRQAANRQGETIYKGHRSYDLMLSLQLGMRHSIGDVAAAAGERRLTPEHFGEKVLCLLRTCVVCN